MKDHLDNLIRQLTADKKKLGIMLSALALGLLLWGRLLLQGVPRTATAENPGKTAQADKRADETGQASPSEQPMPVIHVDLPSHPGRDPFGIDPSRYKRNPEALVRKMGAKSPQVTPDEDPRVAAVRQEAMELRLESGDGGPAESLYQRAPVGARRRV